MVFFTSVGLEVFPQKILCSHFCTYFCCFTLSEHFTNNPSKQSLSLFPEIAKICQHNSPPSCFCVLSNLSNPNESEDLKRWLKISPELSPRVNCGCIRESLSPFLINSHLAPKQNETWHMYVDSMAINNISIKCRFFIPHIEWYVWWIIYIKGLL